jgi:esterase/lipase superfamily enzyme
MKPLSDDLRTLLDEICAVLARGEEPPDALLAQLESRWRAERPDDLGSLKALLTSLRARADDPQLASASDGLREGRTKPTSHPLKIPHEKIAMRAYEKWSKRGHSHSVDVQDWIEAEAELRAELAAGRREARPADPFAITKGAEEEEGWVYPVFFGTNRAPVDPAKPGRGFSARRATAVTYGHCDVWVPPTHRFGETGTVWWKRWKRFQFADDHLRLRNTDVLAGEGFWAALKEEMSRAEGGKPHGLVFLHGYRVSFEDAAIRAAQIGFDLKVSGATAFFSWPSQGTLKGYPADAAAVEASEDAITRFLADFVRRSGAAVVHLVAHSMGNRGLLRALQRLAADAQLAAGVKFGQIFLAAPDVDRDLFLGLARLYPRFSERTTLYASDKDKALAMSAWLYSGPRAGYFLPVTVADGVDHLDTVTVPDFDLDLLGHSYFAQAEGVLYDMIDLARHDTPPGQRPRLTANGGHWVMRR